MSKVEGKKKWLLLILLQLVIMIYTLSGVAAKFAAGYEFLSMGFILCYGVEICILGSVSYTHLTLPTNSRV